MTQIRQLECLLAKERSTVKMSDKAERQQSLTLALRYPWVLGPSKDNRMTWLVLFLLDGCTNVAA